MIKANNKIQNRSEQLEKMQSITKDLVAINNLEKRTGNKKVFESRKNEKRKQLEELRRN